MKYAPVSSSGVQLLRALLKRSGLDSHRISIGRFHSVDWQSLIFTGERHEISLRLAGPRAARALALLRGGLADVEWRLDGHIVVDVVIVAAKCASDGSIIVAIEALTLID